MGKPGGVGGEGGSSVQMPGVGVREGRGQMAGKDG